ncbi:FAD-dependent oxidoreductase [Eggerthella timonensis]|uniref:FAD-dependent oxidoreductase n=1 Tax=Eggerthella timonensis TaxID=1871008 RepID=UPI000C771C39|nr:FAD-dependent oxidoreductase [Eggerthella timonensis]
MGSMFTRRQFVVGAMVLGGSLALTGCSPQPESKKQDGASGAAASEATEADIVVIGSGLAGAACSISAAQNGARVILVDKAPFLTSTFLTSKGNVSIAQVPENQADWRYDSEAPDTMDQFVARYRDLTEIGKVDAPYPDYDRMQHLMEESCATIAWVEQMGITFEKSFTKEMVGTDTVKPDVSADPATEAGVQLANVFAAEFERLGVQTMLSTEATELVKDGDAVVGVKVKGPDGTQELRAKSVVLATGGFGGSAEYCDKLVPAINEMGFQYLGNAMNTGDGMTMASAIGAALYEDPWVIPNVIMPTRALTKADAGFKKLCDTGMEGAATSSKMLVDATGARFVNEAAPVTALATSMTDSQAGPYYVLFDSSNAEVAALIEKGLSTGDALKADSVEELAAAAAAPQLVATFEAYQQAAAAGVDEAFGKKADMLAAYGDGPFYLVKFVPSYVATMGGVKTDASCQALGEDGSPIPGLFAVGEATHRFMYNRSFVRHCSNSSALTMGRLTGAALATA